MTALSSDGFVVTWVSYSQDGSYDGVYAQVYGSDATTTGTSASETLSATTAVETFTGNGGDDVFEGTTDELNGDIITDFNESDVIRLVGVTTHIEFAFVGTNRGKAHQCQLMSFTFQSLR